ncbi:Hypothetical predicted protein, partial [Marmota monax]
MGERPPRCINAMAEEEERAERHGLGQLTSGCLVWSVIEEIAKTRPGGVITFFILTIEEAGPLGDVEQGP